MNQEPKQGAQNSVPDLDIDKLEALARAATPGPWVHRFDPGNPIGVQHGVKLEGEYGCWVADFLDNADLSTEGGMAGERNAAFVAGVNPATVLALIALARRATPAGREAPTGWRDRIAEMREASYTISQYPEIAEVVFDSVIDALDELESAAHPVEAIQPTDEPLWIQLGQGKIEVGQGHHGHEHLPAILFGRNGAGAVGVETEGDRFMTPGECIAAITFENPESLDVVAEKLAELRARIWPTPPEGANK